jgi:hypothetical protein
MFNIGAKDMDPDAVAEVLSLESSLQIIIVADENHSVRDGVFLSQFVKRFSGIRDLTRRN